MFYFPKLGTYSSSPRPLYWTERSQNPAACKARLLGISNTAYSKLDSLSPTHPILLQVYLPSCMPHIRFTGNQKYQAFLLCLVSSIEAIKKFCWFWSLDMSYLSSPLCTSYLLLSWPLLSLVDSNSGLSKNDLQSTVPLRVLIDQNWMVFFPSFLWNNDARSQPEW